MRYEGAADVGLLLIAIVVSFVVMAGLFGLFVGLAWRVAQWII